MQRSDVFHTEPFAPYVRGLLANHLQAQVLSLIYVPRVKHIQKNAPKSAGRVSENSQVSEFCGPAVTFDL